MQAGIRRIQSPAGTRARAAGTGGLIITVATARSPLPGVEAQTREALRALDENLRASASDKTCLLFVLAMLNDIASKPEFSRAWDDWVVRTSPPVRACVGVHLESGDLVELVAVAIPNNEAIRTG